MKTLPQVYQLQKQCRVSFQGLKILEPRIHAYIKGGGLEDFGSWAKFNKGATLKEIKARMDKYHPGRFEALAKKKVGNKVGVTHNLSSKKVHAHHKHQRKGDPTSRSSRKVTAVNANIHINIMHARKLIGKSTDPKRLRIVRTIKLRAKILKDSKKWNRKCHIRTMKEVEAQKPWLKKLKKLTYSKEIKNGIQINCIVCVE